MPIMQDNSSLMVLSNAAASVGQEKDEGEAVSERDAEVPQGLTEMTAEGRLAGERRGENNRKEHAQRAQIKIDTLAKQQVELAHAAEAAAAAAASAQQSPAPCGPSAVSEGSDAITGKRKCAMVDITSTRKAAFKVAFPQLARMSQARFRKQPESFFIAVINKLGTEEWEPGASKANSKAPTRALGTLAWNVLKEARHGKIEKEYSLEEVVVQEKWQKKANRGELIMPTMQDNSSLMVLSNAAASVGQEKDEGEAVSERDAEEPQGLTEMTAEGRLAGERRGENNRKEHAQRAQIKIHTLAKQQVELAHAAAASRGQSSQDKTGAGWNDLEDQSGNDGRSARALSKQSKKLGEGKETSHRGKNRNTFLQSSFSSSFGFAPPKKNSGSLSHVPSGRVGQNTAADAETQTELLPGIPELQLLQPVKT